LRAATVHNETAATPSPCHTALMQLSTYIRQRVWRWLAISATGAAVAALVRVVIRRDRARPPASRPSDEAAREAALELAGGAMSDEGAPARNF